MNQLLGFLQFLPFSEFVPTWGVVNSQQYLCSIGDWGYKQNQANEQISDGCENVPSAAMNMKKMKLSEHKVPKIVQLLFI